MKATKVYSPSQLGTVTVHGDGTFTKVFTIPTNTPAGEHRVVATPADTTQAAAEPVEAKFTVLQRSTGGPNTNGGTPLANTGTPAPTPLGWTTAALLLAGTTTLLLRPRTTRRTRR